MPKYSPLCSSTALRGRKRRAQQEESDLARTIPLTKIFSLAPTTCPWRPQSCKSSSLCRSQRAEKCNTGLCANRGKLSWKSIQNSRGGCRCFGLRTFGGNQWVTSPAAVRNLWLMGLKLHLLFLKGPSFRSRTYISSLIALQHCVSPLAVPWCYHAWVLGFPVPEP